MIVKCATIYIKEEYIDAFIEASQENQKNSVLEEGVAVFDILQSKEDKGTFVFYEAYLSEQAVEDHTKTPHFNKWNDLVQPWFSKPRERVLFDLVEPK